MTPQEFYNTYLGQCIDYDGAYGYQCYRHGSYITKSDGTYSKVEDIRVGDILKGGNAVIENTPIKTDIYEIHTSIGWLYVSNDHRFIMKDGSEKTPSELNRKDLLNFDLDDSEEKFNLTIDELKFLGFWIGDGYLKYRWKNSTRPAIGITIGNARKEEFIKSLNISLHIANHSNGRAKEGHLINSEHETLMLAIQEIVGKNLPQHYSAEQYKYIIEGYCMADGCKKSEGNYYVCTSIDKPLLLSIQHGCMLNGFKAKISKVDERKETNICSHPKPIYKMTISFAKKPNAKIIFVKKLPKQDTVYRIEVNGNHLYYGENVLSHNCVDGFRVFCKWCNDNGVPITNTITPNNYADGYWYSRDALKFNLTCDYITDYTKLQDGDWCFWAKGSGSHPLSHVAMYYKGQQFGERQGGNNGFSLKACNFTDILGAFRLKVWNNGGDVVEHGNDLEQINAQGTATSTRKIATSFIVYAKTGTTPAMSLVKETYEGSQIYAVQVKLDSNTWLCTSYNQDTEWLCKMQSEWMLNNGWYEIACVNAGYFEMSGNVGKPTGAVMVDWAGKWSQWYGSDCVPAQGNGYPTLAWNDTTMSLLDLNADKIDLTKYRWLQGVGQSLVINSKVDCSVGSTNGRYNTANNASAIGFNQSTSILTLMANVKSSTGSGTLNTLQRAYVMQGLGCSLAVQLDGGGSTQLEWLASALNDNHTPDPVDPEPDNPTDDDKDKEIAELKAQLAEDDAKILKAESYLDSAMKALKGE